jgi:biopolymer transport protein ExbD
MTPMIDVVFLLLIFFICASARQAREALLAATLPTGSIEAALSAAPVQVDQAFVKLKHREGGTVAEINDTDYPTIELLETQLQALAQVGPDVPVILDVDGPVPFGDVIRVYDLCQRLHFTTIKFAIDLKKTPVK